MLTRKPPIPTPRTLSSSKPADLGYDRTCIETISLAVGLGIISLVAKAILLPFPVTTLGEFVRWLLRLAIVVAPDICFVAGLLAICLAWGRLAARSRARRQALGLWTIRLAFFLAALYAVASVPIYQWTMVPLTLQSLWLAGGGSIASPILASSVIACAGTGAFLACLLVPCLLLALPTLTRRIPWLGSAPPPARGILLAFILVAVYGFVCRSYVQAQWSDPNRWERRIAQNPHMVFVASSLKLLFHREVVDFFDNPDESDFLRIQPRPDARPLSQLIPQDARPKNVILIVLESTGVEHLGLYGSKHDTTPNLQRLAQDGGVTFENLYVQSPSSCKSLAALMASIYPRIDPWRRLLVRDFPDFKVPTIAETVAEQGYRTCFAHSGYWNYMKRDRFLRRRGASQLIDAESLPGQSVNSWGVADRAMFQAALDWIDEKPRQPFFLLAYTIETHHPYVAREPLQDFGVEDPDLNRYLNALKTADETIGWLMDELRRRGLDRSTLVAITADHGESFGGHNQRIHSFSIYESAVHVPLILLHPCLKNFPRRIDAVCQHIDIAPTLLHLLGIDVPDAWQGRSLLQEKARRAARPAYFCALGNEIVLGLRDGNLKYHYYLDSGHEELFNVAADSAESHNLAAGHPQRCQLYRRKLGGWVRYQRRFLSQHGAP